MANNNPLFSQKGTVSGAIVLGIGLFGLLSMGGQAYMTYQERQELNRRVEQVQVLAENRRDKAEEIASSDEATAEVLRRQANQLDAVANVLQGGSDIILRAQVRGQGVDLAQGQILQVIDKVIERPIGPAVDVIKLVYSRINVETEGQEEHQEYAQRLSRGRVSGDNLYREVLNDMFRTIYIKELGGRFSDSGMVLDPEKMAVAENRFRTRIKNLPSETLSLPAFQQAYDSVLGTPEKESESLPEPQPTVDNSCQAAKECLDLLRKSDNVITSPEAAMCVVLLKGLEQKDIQCGIDLSVTTPEKINNPTPSTEPQKTGTDCQKEYDVCADRREILIKQYFKRQKEIVDAGNDIDAEPYRSELEQLWEQKDLVGVSCIDSYLVCCKAIGVKNPSRNRNYCAK